MKSILVCFGLLALTGLAFAVGLDQASRLCVAVGSRSGCSGCNLGRLNLTCEWCVDPSEQSGFSGHHRQALCLPRGQCATASGGGRVSAPPALCPADHAKQAPFGGEDVRPQDQVVYNSFHYPKYCALDYNYKTNSRFALAQRANFSYAIDRTLPSQSSRCWATNNDFIFGIGRSIGVVARYCFHSQPHHLTPRQIACLEAVEAFRCTSACPQYGVAAKGYCMSGCNQIRHLCEGYWGQPQCDFEEVSVILDNNCVDDSNDLTCEYPLRLKAADAWGFEYGLRKNYLLPVDCEWNDWGAWGSCETPCGSGTKTRFRTKKIFEANGGLCFGSPIATTSCVSATPCAWGPWSACTGTCGAGTRQRTKVDGTVDTQACAAGGCGFNVRVAASYGFVTDVRDLITWLTSTLYSNFFTVNYQNTLDSLTIEPNVQFQSAGQVCGNFASEQRLLPGTDNDLQYNVNYEDYHIHAKGTITIPSTGTYTFGVISDDGFYLKLTGPSTNVLEYDAPRAPGDSRATWSLTAGDYNVEFIFYERGGGDCVSLFSCPGTVGAGTFTGCASIGNVAQGGLKVVPWIDPAPVNLQLGSSYYNCPVATGISFDARRASVGICNYEDAENLLNGAIPSIQTVTGKTNMVDYNGNSVPGTYGLDLPTPFGNSPNYDNYAMSFTGTIDVPADGYWSFSVLSDDGFSLQFDSNPRMTMAFLPPRGAGFTVKAFFMTQGLHTFRLAFYECGGLDGVEFSAAQGIKGSWDSTFRRVGDGALPLTVNTAPAASC